MTDMKRLLLSLTFLLSACQSAPLALSHAPGIAAQSAAEHPESLGDFSALDQLNPAQLSSLQSSLNQRSPIPANSGGARLSASDPTVRKLLETLMPMLQTSYQQMIHPRVITSTQLPPGAQGVTLNSHDGIPLQAAYLRASQPVAQAVIVLHGYQLNKYMAWKKYRFLQDRYNVLLLDQRGHDGQSGAVTLGVLEQRDLPAAIRWLQQQGNQSFALFGESMGAAVAIDAGANWVLSPEQQSFPLKAVWNDAAYADLEHALDERVLRKLNVQMGMTPEGFRRRAAGLITQTFLSWLAQDTQVADAEAAAAPVRHLPALVQRAAYGQVHSREDKETNYANAEILQQAAAKQPGVPPFFWATVGDHVESYRQSDYAPKALDFLQQAFARR